MVKTTTPDTVTSSARLAASGPANEPGTGETCPASLPYPRTLPNSVKGWATQTCGGNVARWTLTLAGGANADTRATSGANSPDAHAGSVVNYSVSFPSPTGPPGWAVLPSPVVNDSSVKSRTTTLPDGSTARVTTPVSGYGMSRVEWIKDGSYFQILCDHGDTPTQGLTGLSDSDLVALANSVR